MALETGERIFAVGAFEFADENAGHIIARVFETNLIQVTRFEILLDFEREVVGETTNIGATTSMERNQSGLWLESEGLAAGEAGEDVTIGELD